MMLAVLASCNTFDDRSTGEFAVPPSFPTPGFAPPPLSAGAPVSPAGRGGFPSFGGSGAAGGGATGGAAGAAAVSGGGGWQLLDGGTPPPPGPDDSGADDAGR